MDILGDLPITFWFTIGQAVSLTASSLVLSIQRAHTYRHRKHCYQGNGNPSSAIKTDSEREIINFPFSDGNRLSRINLEAVCLTIVAIYTLRIQVQAILSESNRIIQLISYIVTLVLWIYSLLLSLAAMRYPLPNAFGWTLNLHMFLIYSVLWVSSIGNLIYEIFWQSSNSHVLILACPVIIGADMVFSTATVKNGSPFIDANGKLVNSKNVESIIGIIFFNWLTPMVAFINDKRSKLEDTDLPTLSVLHRARNLFYISGETRAKSVLMRLIIANRSALAKQAMLCSLAVIAQFGQPLFLNKLLLLIQDITTSGETDSTSLVLGLTFVIGMAISGSVDNLLTAHLWYYAHSSVKIRFQSMLNIEIYQKTLRCRDTSLFSASKKSSLASKTNNNVGDDANKKEVDEDNISSLTGMVVNLMSTDAARVSDVACWWIIAITAPMELTIGIYFLYRLIGWSSILGIMVIVMTLPLNHINTKVFIKSQDLLMKARDKRVSLMNEALQGIRQIKFFAWESDWTSRIMESRTLELGHLSMIFVTEVISSVLWEGTPLLVITAAFWSFTKLEGQELTAPIAFTSLAIFNELRFSLTIIPQFVIRMSEALVSARRIHKYLLEEEIATTDMNPSTSEEGENGTSTKVKIGFENATTGWPSAPNSTETSTLNQSEEVSQNKTSSFVLKDLNVIFPNNQLSLVCGPTGSGKTLLILSLLGEAEIKAGQVYCPRSVPFSSLDDSTTITSFQLPSSEVDVVPPHWILDHAVAYVSQTPWLQNASIKNNILFGLPYAAKRYEATLTACALDKDLSYLDDGDETEIGEKGITLSGGQKARVALARAVYSRAQNVFLDNILSAIDAHTAKHVHEKCLLGPLMQGRTQILVTHHINLCIHQSAHVVLIKEGRIHLSGSPAVIRTSGQMELLLEKPSENQDKSNEEAGDAKEINEVKDGASPIEEEERTQKNKKPKVLVEEEKRAEGMVKLRLYRLYNKLVGGYFFWTAFGLMIVGARCLDIGSSWWLKQWAQSYETNSGSISSITWNDRNTQIPILHLNEHTTRHVLEDQRNDDLNMYLGIYALLNFLSMFIGTARHAAILWGGLNASKKLYKLLLDRVFHAPLRFFDTTPIGRIVNRFSKDFETVDASVPSDLVQFIIQLVCVVSILIVASAAFPILLVPMVFVAFVNVYFGTRYLSASRELKRMDSISRSPLFTQFSETIVGVTTIRAFGMTQYFMLEMLDRIDANSRPLFYAQCMGRWVSVRISIAGSLITLFTGVVILWNVDILDAAMAGFCLSYVSVFANMTYWGVQKFTQLEMSYNAIERVVEFMEIDQEAKTITDTRAPSKWPSRGAIEIKDLHVRYAADLENILKGLNVSIKPKEKVGIVGRTGSGKSTLALSFFRFIEPYKGSIVIDNVDIAQIGLEDLRSNLTIIPQDPVLFSGTLRSNMDPFNQFTDEDIFTALRRVHLLDNDGIEADVNQNVFNNLETLISEGGNNFSQGQRQLLCLARALLKCSKVVLMDEATASVDFETDKAIQKTITNEFEDCTILCIAHRLHTIIEYDRILVLDCGRVLEYASPLDLLSDTSSEFYKMCYNSGEFENLVAHAKAKHELVDIL